MSYTRPSPSAADASWAGQTAYTRLSPAAADAQFSNGYQASGWKAASFGTPAVALTASGFNAVQFGTAAIAFPQTVDVSGFSPATFGFATVLGSYAVASFRPASFGSPSLLPHAVGFRPFHFGMPTLSLDVVSLRSVHVGSITAIQRNRVSAWRAARAGAPTVPTDRTAVCTCFRPRRFGHVVCARFLSGIQRHHGHVYHLRPVHFGTPTI